MDEDKKNKIKVLDAVQLGWLSVESFACLRRWSRTGRTPKSLKGDDQRRFNFSNRELTDYQQVIISLDLF